MVMRPVFLYNEYLERLLKEASQPVLFDEESLKIIGSVGMYFISKEIVKDTYLVDASASALKIERKDRNGELHNEILIDGSFAAYHKSVIPSSQSSGWYRCANGQILSSLPFKGCISSNLLRNLVFGTPMNGIDGGLERLEEVISGYKTQQKQRQENISFLMSEAAKYHGLMSDSQLDVSRRNSLFPMGV